MNFRVIKDVETIGSAIFITYYPQYQVEDDKEWNDMCEDGTLMAFDKFDDAKNYIFRTIARGREPIPKQEVVWNFTPTENCKNLLQLLEIGKQ